MPCFFDIETDGLHEDAKITCVVTANANEVKMWHSNYADFMTRSDLISLIDYLCRQDLVVSFNGAHFDFKVLYYCTLDPRAISLAFSHLDICYCFAVDKGYFTSLNSFMQGSGITGKNGSGFDAIEKWLCGGIQEKNEILNYCKNDVRCLKDLYNLMITPGASIYRLSKKGRKLKWKPRLLTVQHAMQRYKEKPPDVSWMTRPILLDKILDWQYSIPGLAKCRWESLVDQHQIERWARASNNLNDFDCAMAEYVYANKLNEYEDDSL